MYSQRAKNFFGYDVDLRVGKIINVRPNKAEHDVWMQTLQTYLDALYEVIFADDHKIWPIIGRSKLETDRNGKPTTADRNVIVAKQYQEIASFIAEKSNIPINKVDGIVLIESESIDDLSSMNKISLIQMVASDASIYLERLYQIQTGEDDGYENDDFAKIMPHLQHFAGTVLFSALWLQKNGHLVGVESGHDFNTQMNTLIDTAIGQSIRALMNSHHPDAWNHSGIMADRYPSMLKHLGNIANAALDTLCDIPFKSYLDAAQQIWIVVGEGLKMSGVAIGLDSDAPSNRRFQK